jgi:hypothetical protein
MPLAAAARYRNGARARRALVLGVYLAGKPNTADHIAATLRRSRDLDVRQRWVALGGEPSNGELGSVTALTVSEPAPKYSLLNRLLAEEDLDSYDFVLTTDDDIVLPDGFLDLFVGVQSGVGFQLAQPARTRNSYVDHPIVLQQRGVIARRTLFVEIGPLVSFGREIYDLVGIRERLGAPTEGARHLGGNRRRGPDRPQHSPPGRALRMVGRERGPRSVPGTPSPSLL